MTTNSKSKLSVVALSLFLVAAPEAFAQRGGGHRGGGQGSSGGAYRSSGGGHSGRSSYAASGRHYSAPQRNFYYSGGNRGFVGGSRYVAAPRGYFGGGFSSGRYYSGRGYFYDNRFWARPYFGIGIGIPFGYGYRTNRGCGYIDGWGAFHPAPCYDRYYSGY